MFHIAEYARPELYAVAERQRVRMRRAFFWARQNVQASQDDFCATAAIAVGQCVGASRKRQVNRDADNFRNRVEWRKSVE